MTLTKDTNYILFLAVTSFLLLVLIFYWIDYLSINKYIVESFQQLNDTTISIVDVVLPILYGTLIKSLPPPFADVLFNFIPPPLLDT